MKRQKQKFEVHEEAVDSKKYRATQAQKHTILNNYDSRISPGQLSFLTLLDIRELLKQQNEILIAVLEEIDSQSSSSSSKGWLKKLLNRL